MSRSSISPLGALIAEVRDQRTRVAPAGPAGAAPPAPGNRVEPDLRLETRVVSGSPPGDPSARSWRWPVSLALHAAPIVVLVALPLLRPDATPPAPSTAVALAAAAANSARPAAPTARPPVRPVRVGGDVPRPTKLKHVDPIYPAAAAATKAHGTVTLECVVSTQGRVTGIKVLSGVPLLDGAAVDAVKQWVFTPTLRHRVAVPVILTVAVQFGGEDPPAHGARMASGM